MNNLKIFTILLPLLGFSTQAYSTQPEEFGEVETNALDQPSRTAYIDPNTGKLTSIPSDRTSSSVQQALVTQSILPAVEFRTHSNGTVQAKLNGRFRTPLVARIDCDGKITMQHTETAKIDTIDCGVSE